MTATDLAPRQAATPERQYRVTGKVKAAIDAMVWTGLKRSDAAQAAGLKDNSLYVALSRPDVKAYYMRQLDVLRTSEIARSIHALADVRDQTGNQMARVAASKTLLQVNDEVHQRLGAGGQALPGFVIVVQAPSPHMPHEREIEAKPLIDNDIGHIEGVGTDE